VPSEPARNRLQETLLDPAKIIAGLLAVAVPVVISVFKLSEKLPDSIKHQLSPEQLTGIVTILLWSVIAIALILWNRWRDRRRHPDGRPKPGKVAIYVAELKGDDKQGSHRNHILLSLRQQLGASVQILRAGIELRDQEKGNPEDDARDANREGQKYLNHKKYEGDLLIWGQVLDEKKLVELRFNSRAHDSAEQKRFNLTEKLLLASDFGPELAAALAAIAAQLALPAFNPGKYVANVLIHVAEKLSRIVANPPASMGPEQRGLLLRSYSIAEQTIGEQRGDSDSLRRAVAAYRQALKVYTRERVPLDWAGTQNNLGNALASLNKHESGTESLEDAVVAFREALKERTREKVPLAWATTQNNLGTALSSLGERERGTEQLEAAIAAFREALKECTRARVPLQWAGTQSNIGNALMALGERKSGTEQLETAVAVYRESLKEWTREKVPLLWASAQNNLGTALKALGRREDGTERLEAAVKAFRKALKERTRDKVPLQWAKTQNNLGNALTALGERESGRESLEAAVADYREALKEYTRERVPIQWAATQNNLGIALKALGERESGTERLEAAVAAYREALKELTREKVPLQWASTQNNLGNALTALGERESGRERLAAAVVAYREALEEWAREKVPLDWAAAQNNLGYAFESMGKLDEAAESYRLALQVLTTENHSQMYTKASNNLSRVLEKLRAGKDIK
jgi:tetratricopeptide (TPR) repeat protein